MIPARPLFRLRARIRMELLRSQRARRQEIDTDELGGIIAIFIFFPVMMRQINIELICWPFVMLLFFVLRVLVLMS